MSQQLLMPIKYLLLQLVPLNSNPFHHSTRFSLREKLAHGEPRFERCVLTQKKELNNSERSQTTQAKYLNRGHSSVGRALPWHGRGQGFESPWLHHVKSLRDHVAQPNTMQLEAQSDFTCHGTT